jgi:tRNA(Ile)-lysidine synthase
MNETWKHKITSYLSQRSPIFVACSGGMDSVALLHILYKMGIQPIALHCNFQLRGKESDEDERWLRNFCKNLGIECKVSSFDTRKTIAETGGNVQSVARDLRYNWFNQILTENPTGIICTAHHQNDNIEQLLMTAISSGKLLELAGIPEKRAGFYRPFLSVKKEEIRLYLEENKLFWREDSSNAGNNYTRNKIRNQVLPLLEEIDKRTVSALNELQREINVLKTQLTNQIDQWLNKQENLHSFLLPFTLWDEQLDVWKQLFIQKITNHSIHLTELEKLKNASNSAFFELGNFRITKEEKGFFFTENSVIEDFYQKIELEKSIETPLGTFLLIQTDEANLNKEKSIVFLDADKLKGELHIRSLKNGDKMIPLGKSTSVKISKLLIEDKIPLHLRKQQLVVCDDKKIVWLVGVRLSEEVKLEKLSRKLKKMQIIHK